MGSILTLVVTAYFFIISYKFKFSYLFFVFLIPFLPKYIGFGVGSEGFSLSLKRILLMLLFMAFLLSIIQNKEYIFDRISTVYRQNKLLINLLLLVFILQVVSLSLGKRELSLYIMLFNDFLFSIFIFILTILLINSEDDIHRLAKVFFYGYSIVLVLVFIEYFIRFPLLSIFSSGEMKLDRDYAEAFFRGGSYRVNGSFLSPILLGEYLIILFPIVMAYINKKKYSLIFKIVFLLFFLFAVYATVSRSSILMTAILFYLYFIFTIYRYDKNVRFFIKLFNAIVIVIVVYIVFNYINDLIINFSGRFDKLGDEDTISSTSRALQYITIYDKMHEAPFFGFGRMRNNIELLSGALVGTIDNYYFSLILEVGLIGIFIYLFFLFALVNTALKQYSLPHENYYLFPVLLGILMSILFGFLMAYPANHIYLYIFAGLISVMKVLQNEKKEELKYHKPLKDKD